MIWSTINNLNTSKLFAGIVMILLNVGSKYVTLDISKTQESFLSNTIIRRLLVFTIVFTATRDLVISILLTAAFVILVSGMFNENSKMCILPKKYYKLKDENITAEEAANARYILQLYENNEKSNTKTQYEKEVEKKNNTISKFKEKTKLIRDKPLINSWFMF